MRDEAVLPLHLALEVAGLEGDGPFEHPHHGQCARRVHVGLEQQYRHGVPQRGPCVLFTGAHLELSGDVLAQFINVA